jgi:ribonuclease P protein component
VSARIFDKESIGEAHLSAQQSTEGTTPRLPPSDGLEGGSCRPSVPPTQGSPSAVGLSGVGSGTAVPVWRIRDRRTFVALRAHGRRRRSGPITVISVPDPVGDPPRVAYAIGKRVGGAVVRNRLRRQAQALIAEVPPAPGAYLVSLGPGALQLDRPALARHLGGALGTAPLEVHP